MTIARWERDASGPGLTEIHNLAAISFGAASWIQPTLAAEFTGVSLRV